MHVVRHGFVSWVARGRGRLTARRALRLFRRPFAAVPAARSAQRTLSSCFPRLRSPPLPSPGSKPAAAQRVDERSFTTRASGSVRPPIATHRLGLWRRGAARRRRWRHQSRFILWLMRILGACSLGGAGHFNPLVAFLRAARRRGDEVLTVGPPALREMVESAGFAFRAGGEPSEEQVAAIRERLPVAPAGEASVLGNRELFGRLATTAMLAGMKDAWGEWLPDLVLRDPTEYASAVLAAQTQTPIAQVAISLAEAEAGSIAAAAPALEEHHQSLVSELQAQPYLTRFPASIDPSPFEHTVRYHEPREMAVSLPDWWRGSDAPVIYMTFGTVLGYMSIAAETYRMALEAVKRTNARVLLTVGRRFDASTLGAGPGTRPRGALDRPGAGARPRRLGGVPWRLGDRARRVGSRRPPGHGAALRRPVRKRSTDREDTIRTGRRNADHRRWRPLCQRGGGARDHQKHRGRTRGRQIPGPSTSHRRRDGGHADRRGGPDTPTEPASVNRAAEATAAEIGPDPRLNGRSVRRSSTSLATGAAGR